jgi:predicted amidohydrolase
MNITAVIAQFPVSLSIKDNLEVMDSVLEQTAPGDLVLFPEGAISGYAPDIGFLQQIDRHALTAGIEHLEKEARKRGINIWAGACIRNDNKWLNAAYGFSPDGTTRVYYKINLANLERGVFSAGNDLPLFELDFPAGKALVGIQICRELRYPEQWTWLARQGAQIFLHLNNAVGDSSFQPVWRSHLVSRAAETQRYVLSANNAASEQVSPTIAIGPDGKSIGEIVAAEAGILRVQLDLSKVSNLYLDQSRTDVIAIKSTQK